LVDLDNQVRPRPIELRPASSRGELVVARAEPRVQPGSIHRRYSLFIWTFVAPVVAAIVYLFVIASDRYVSEAQFIIRASSSSATEGGAMLTERRGLARARDESYVVTEYICSRDALERLTSNEGLRQVFSRQEADSINKFPNVFSRNTFEEYYKYYKKMVTAEVDGGTGIGTIRVTAFTAEDAQRIASALLASAENFINRLNERARADTLMFADKNLAEARDRVVETEKQLSSYRTRSKMIDPSGEMTAAFDTITRLSTELAHTQATLQQQLALTPNSPSIAALRQKVDAIRAEIASRRAQMAGSDGSIATKIAAYDQLELEKRIAEKALIAAEQNREQARQASEKQQLYLQAVVEPNRPDQARYPRRIFDLAGVVAVCGICFSILRSLRRLAAEHMT
jgi:capsular polysaccharide transport system permease protein